MAIQTLIFQSKIFVPVRPCQEVAVCLDDEALTEDGSGLIIATVQNNGRFLGTAGATFHPVFENPRDVEFYQYELKFDDTQLAAQSAVRCENIIEIFPYACTIQKIKALITA